MGGDCLYRLEKSKSMGGVLNNILTSGHSFSESDNLQRFRFSLLNCLLLIAAVFTLLNYFSSILEIVPFAPIYEKTLLFYLFACLFSLYLLRQKKSNFIFVVNNIVVCSLVLFYMALFVVLHDEFRLIWFFLVVFASFVLMGKKYGIILTLLLLVSILLINQSFDLGFSQLAQFTFFNSFLIFTAFSYFFLAKIEKDAVEFELLNSKLESKVVDEVRQRKEQEEMLLRQSRMANMGEMLDSIAHQWRQPLMHINSILMNMDNSLEPANENKRSKKYLEIKIDEVATLTAHMSQTIEDFRGLFKVEKEKTHIVLESAINDVLTLMKNGFNNIDVVCKVQSDTTVFAHRSELIQLIIIILSNAVEVLNIRNVNDKRITIDARASKGNESTKESVVITIEDSAGGISTENVEVIFTPYFTTKEQSGGTGLGLYIAKLIVEQKMNGTIKVQNTSHGAIFTIVI